jgi:hypothetical protein
MNDHFHLTDWILIYNTRGCHCKCIRYIFFYEWKCKGNSVIYTNRHNFHIPHNPILLLCIKNAYDKEVTISSSDIKAIYIFIPYYYRSLNYFCYIQFILDSGLLIRFYLYDHLMLYPNHMIMATRKNTRSGTGSDWIFYDGFVAYKNLFFLQNPF